MAVLAFFPRICWKLDLSCEDSLVCLNLLTILSDKCHISKVLLVQQRATSCGNIIHFNSLCGVGGLQLRAAFAGAPELLANAFSSL